MDSMEAAIIKMHLEAGIFFDGGGMRKHHLIQTFKQITQTSLDQL